MRYRTQTARQETVPSQAMRNGDFTGFDPIHDLDGTPFGGNIIPPDRFDPRATAILQFYPLPIQGGANNFATFNHTINVPNPILSDQFDIRIDHTINSKQNVFGRWTYKNIRRVSPNLNGTDQLLPSENNFEHDNQIVIAHNYAITPNLINELRGGLSRSNSGGTFRFDGP